MTKLCAGAHHACRICGGPLGSELRVREMMFGMRDEFVYRQCEQCTCLQIEQVPKELDRYYPQHYYSYELIQHGSAKRRRRGARRNLVLSAPMPVSRSMRLLSGSDNLFHLYRFKLGLRTSSKVLDVGAGSGVHVLELREAGVEKAFGVDPFIADTIYRDEIPLVYKANLSQLREKYDFITFHHSLEHIPEQLQTLKKAAEMVSPRGKILIRIPTCSSLAFEEYGANWVGLDAPRHLYLHSHRSLRFLASAAGLIVSDLWCDSGPMQFMASEQYRRDIPLMDSHSAIHDDGRQMFSIRERLAFKMRTILTNRRLMGDSICAVLSVARSG